MSRSTAEALCCTGLGGKVSIIVQGITMKLGKYELNEYRIKNELETTVSIENEQDEGCTVLVNSWLQLSIY